MNPSANSFAGGKMPVVGNSSSKMSFGGKRNQLASGMQSNETFRKQGAGSEI